MPEPTLWQFPQRFPGLVATKAQALFQEQKTACLVPVAGTESLGPPASWWELVCFIARGEGFPSGIPHGACSGAMPTPAPPQSQPPLRPCPKPHSCLPAANNPGVALRFAVF